MTKLGEINNKIIKPNLVLIHGWGFNSSIWKFNQEYLTKKYNIIYIDLNGHGQNEYNEQYHSLKKYCDYLSTKIPDDSIILGWSLGGLIALNFAEHYPTKTKRLILCCSNTCFIKSDNWPYGVDQKFWDEFSNNLIIDQAKTIKYFMVLQTLDHKNAKGLSKQLINIHKTSNQASSEGLAWGLSILKQDFREALNHIDNSKITFILGSKDKLVNKNIEIYLNKKHPKITTVLLKGSGHIPFITEPVEFYEATAL